MTLGELIDVIDNDRESELDKIQICRPHENWEDYDEVIASSALLVPLYDCKVKTIEAIEEYTIRVDIDWEHVLSSLKWGKKGE